MNIVAIIIAGALAFVIGLIIVYSASTILTKRKKMSAKEKHAALNKRYVFYYDFPLTRKFFRSIHTQICQLSVYTPIEARSMTVKFFERAYLSALALFVIGFIGLGDIISGFVLMLFAVVLINTTVAKRIDEVNFNCLKSCSQLILSLRENYTRLRNVPDSVNEAKCPPLLRKQLDEIYLICTATNAEERLNMFYLNCPNRTIRTLATTCYIRNDAGDDDGEESPFKTGLALVKDEVDMEIRRQLNQNIMFKPLDKLPFIPLFLYPPLKIFYTKMISATAAVFESAIGYIIKLAVVLVSFTCYYVLSTMNNASVSATDDRISSLADLYGGNRKVRKFALTLVTNNYKKRKKVEDTLKGCLSSKDLGYFYLEKTIYGAALFLASIVFSIIILVSARDSIANSLASSVMSVNLTYTPEQEVQTLEYDKSVIEMDVCPTEDEMEDAFRDIFPKASTMEIQTQCERLTTKYENYRNFHFKWWLAFVYISAFFIGYYVPDVLLILRAKLVQSEAEMDVLQLQTIIAILMDTNYDTLAVLGWLTKSSDIHKVPLSNCYHEYVRNPQVAIRMLKEKSIIHEFTAMCDKLETTIHQVTLAEAFEDLISERGNTMKIREVVQLDQLQSKRRIASPIAIAPMIVWMIMVFILPIVIVAVKSAVNMLGNLGTLQ